MAEELQEAVGSRIRQRRRELGMSPGDAAQAFHISIKTLERWERGETGGGIDNIEQVAAELQTDVAALMAAPPMKRKNGATPDPFAPPNAAQLDRIERLVVAIAAHLGIEQDAAEEALDAAEQLVASEDEVGRAAGQ